MTIQLFRNYSTTISLTPVYSLGFAVSCFLVIQIVSGFLLSMAYIAHTELAFKAIHSYLMRDLDSGWLLRSVHSNGASYFMIFIYAHMFRALFYGSTVKSRVWIVGSIIFLLLCAISFTGYSLVWGQLSLWAVVVICSLVTAIPFVGNAILQTIWGGSVVTTVTLQRIYSVHFLLPFVVVFLVMIHLFFLHQVNSSGEIPIIWNRADRVNFYPLLLVRDAFIGALVLTAFCVNVFFFQDSLGHPDNYILANPLVTPHEIAPEFYFLPFYAVVRAIPQKTLGIIALLLLIVSLFNFIPSSSIRWWNSTVSKSIFWNRSLLFIFVIDIFLMSKICLMVNHYDTFYFLLITNVAALASQDLMRAQNAR
jgi:quinol-cytochrome oxidoreductase complex cytochrome b subunit